jgi:hypothetical protein
LGTSRRQDDDLDAGGVLGRFRGTGAKIGLVTR